MRHQLGAERPISELLRERDDLVRSLADLDAELAAGDIAQSDYARLRSGYVARIALVARQLAQRETVLDDAGDSELAKRRSLRRTLGRRHARVAIAALLIFWLLVGVVYIALHFAGVRLPGESATGTVTQSNAVEVQQELEQASAAATTGDISQSIVLYGAVLAKSPDQHQALTYQGWLIRISGIAAHSATVVQHGDAELAHASSVASGYPDAHGLYGIALAVDEHDSAAAIRQFALFKHDRPSNSLLSALGPQIAAVYRQAHLQVPQWIAQYAAKS